MEDAQNGMAMIARTYLGREATPEELFAMAQEMERDAQSIAPHPYGRDGGMFDREPAHFLSIMNAEIER